MENNLKEVEKTLTKENEKVYSEAKKMLSICNRIAIVQSCGTGKNDVLMKFVDDYTGCSKLVIVPSRIFINNFKEKYKEDKIKFLTHEMLKAMDSKQEISKEKLCNPEFIIVDDVHYFKSYKKSLQKLFEVCPDSKAIGMTPFNDKDLVEFFQNVVYHESTKDSNIDKYFSAPSYLPSIKPLSENL